MHKRSYANMGLAATLAVALLLAVGQPVAAKADVEILLACQAAPDACDLGALQEIACGSEEMRAGINGLALDNLRCDGGSLVVGAGIVDEWVGNATGGGADADEQGGLILGLILLLVILIIFLVLVLIRPRHG